MKIGSLFWYCRILLRVRFGKGRSRIGRVAKNHTFCFVGFFSLFWRCGSVPLLYDAFSVRSSVLPTVDTDRIVAQQRTFLGYGKFQGKSILIQLLACCKKYKIASIVSLDLIPRPWNGREVIAMSPQVSTGRLSMPSSSLPMKSLVEPNIFFTFRSSWQIFCNIGSSRARSVVH